jgi:hypothetical protein
MDYFIKMPKTKYVISRQLQYKYSDNVKKRNLSMMESKQLKQLVFFWCMTLLTCAACAQEGSQYSSLPYMTVAESIATMDTDHDGIVSVHEIRVFIESTHGKGYQGKVFDAMEKSADNRVCGSSFSKSLY